MKNFIAYFALLLLFFGVQINGFAQQKKQLCGYHPFKLVVATKTTIGSVSEITYYGFYYAGKKTFTGIDSTAIGMKMVKYQMANVTNFKTWSSNCNYNGPETELVKATHLDLSKWLNKDSKIELTDKHGNRMVITTTKDLKNRSFTIPISNLKETIAAAKSSGYFDVAAVPARSGSLYEFAPTKIKFEVNFNLLEASK